MHSALGLSFMLIAVSSNFAMAIKKEKRLPQTLSRGWGDEITWVQTYEEGLYQAKQSNKPLMVIHHLEDCQYCQGKGTCQTAAAGGFHVSGTMYHSKGAVQGAETHPPKKFSTLHETTDKNLSPDGQYVPRIMFIDPSLTVRADITGRYSNRMYTYEPQDLPVLIENMKKALRLIQTEL